MPKTSKHIDIKPEIEQHFSSGKTAYDVLKLYPGISPGLVYNWFNKFNEPNLNRKPKQQKRLTELEKIQKVEDTILDVLTNKKYLNSPQLAKVRLAAADKMLEMVKLSKEASLAEQFKDADDVTRYFGDHLRINEIVPPDTIEISREKVMDMNKGVKSVIYLRGTLYEIVGSTDKNFICERTSREKMINALVEDQVKKLKAKQGSS